MDAKLKKGCQGLTNVKAKKDSEVKMEVKESDVNKIVIPEKDFSNPSPMMEGILNF